MRGVCTYCAECCSRRNAAVPLRPNDRGTPWHRQWHESGRLPAGTDCHREWRPVSHHPGYFLAGLAERPSEYVAYCIAECDWNDSQYKPKTKEERQKALDDLLSSPKFKGKVEDDEKELFEAQIK